MRKVIARIFDYSADGVVAEEDTDFFQYCRDLPDDPAQQARSRRLYQDADLHIMGRKFYQGAEVERLKQDGTGHIVAHGGFGFWQSLIRLDLIDEYRLTLFPCVAGQGRRLFGELEKSRPLELLSSNSFTNGCVELEYRRAR